MIESRATSTTPNHNLPVYWVLLPLFLALFHSPLWAAFEDRGLGARPIGLGNAFTAVADDIHSMHYNPAGLSQLVRPEVSSSYAKLLIGLDDGSSLGDAFLGYAQPLQGGALGTVATGYKDFRLSNFYTEQTIYMSYGTKIPFYDSLSSGLTLKYLRNGYGTTPETENAIDRTTGLASGSPDPLFGSGRSKSTIGLDLGFLYEISERYKAGLSFLNLNQPNVALSGSDKLPLSTKLGFAYTHPFLNLSVDLDRRKSLHSATDTIFAAGAERWFRTINIGSFALRGSLAAGSREYRQMTIGSSYLNNHFQLDYAFLMPLAGITGTMGTHQVSFTLRFGGPDPEDEFSRMLEKESRARKLAEEKLAKAQSDIQKAKQELEHLKTALAQSQSARSTETKEIRQAQAQAQSSLNKAQARETSAIRSLQSSYNISLNFYKKRSAQGLSLSARIAILERILEKYKGKGLDLNWVERELMGLKDRQEKLQKDYNLSWDYYKRLVDQGAPASESITIIQRIIKKYETSGLDLSEARKELERLRQ